MKTQGRTLGCPFNLLAPRAVAGWFLSVWGSGCGSVLAYEGQTVSGQAWPMRAKRSQAGPISGDPDVEVSGPGPHSGYPGMAVTRLQGAAERCYHSSQAGTPRKGDQPKDWREPTQEPAPFAGTPRSGTFNFDLHGAFLRGRWHATTSSMCCPRLGSNGVKKVEVIGTLWWVTSWWLSCLYSPCVYSDVFQSSVAYFSFWSACVPRCGS